MSKRKPPMPAEHKARAKAAKAKMQDAWTVPGFVFDGHPEERSFACPFRDADKEAWWWLVAEALGTRNQSVILYSLDALTGLCSSRWNENGWEPVPRELNTALAICAAAEPRNEIEAALAMQMVALHFTSLKLGGMLGRMTAPDERTAATLARLAKTYASLGRTLAEMQGKLQPRQVNQTIQVIYLDQRDQRQQTAVVGGAGEFGGQAQAACRSRTLTHNEEKRIESAGGNDVGRAALPSPRSNNGAAMPWASSPGQASLPNAWWWQRLGRALWRC